MMWERQLQSMELRAQLFALNEALNLNGSDFKSLSAFGFY